MGSSKLSYLRLEFAKKDLYYPKINLVLKFFLFLFNIQVVRKVESTVNLSSQDKRDFYQKIVNAFN